MIVPPPGAGTLAAAVVLASAVAAVATGRAQAADALVTVRLITPVSTTTARIGDAVSALVIGLPDAGAAIPPGCTVTGRVAAAGHRERGRDGRAVLRLQLDGVLDSAGVAHATRLRVTAVENARETVDDDGTIVGLAPVRARPRAIETILMLAAHAHPMVLAAAEAIRLGVKVTERQEIAFRPGVDLTLAVPPEANLGTLHCAGPSTTDTPPDAATVSWALALPLRTHAGTPPRDADWINLALVGSRDAIAAAFAQAGWLTADTLSVRADVRTFFAVVEREGYLTGPFSRLSLDGAAPAMTFQKQTNTFAQRHHVRIWPSPVRAPGAREAWVAAATHDIGLAFSHETKHYTHRIDGAIDDERRSLLTDLVATGALAAYGFVARPAVPQQSTNATGDRLTTDGQLVVMTFVDARAEPEPVRR